MWGHICATARGQEVEEYLTGSLVLAQLFQVSLPRTQPQPCSTRTMWQ